MNFSEYLKIWKRALGKGVFPHQLTWILDLPGRELIMSARTVASRLPAAPDAVVLEIGPGSGYYSVEVARRLPYGHLNLLDIQQGMLDKSAEKLRSAGLLNFSTHLSDGQSIPFGTASMDAIFMVTVFGEIEARDSFLREAYRVLKPGGILSITEHHPDPDFESAAEVENAARAQRFIPMQKLGWRWAYTLNLATKG